jgi:AcrR family transcriptional regulator
VSLREIASRAGVTEAGLLHHFGTKEALLCEVLGARDAESAELFGDDLDADDLRALVHHNATAPGLVRLFVDVVAAASQADHPAHEDFRERYRRIRSLGTRAFERQIAERAGAPDGTEDVDAGQDDAAWISRVIFAAMDGLQVQWLLDDRVDMADDIARLHAALITMAVQSRREPGATAPGPAPRPAS